MDVDRAGILGETALAYTLLSYFAIALHRRLLWFKPWGQAAHVFVLFLMAQLVGAGMHLLMGGDPPAPLFLLGPVFTALLWPAASTLLMAPQRMPTDHDETRPL
jgi:rod shape-determining protein MreD